jgi:hypothetical protein
MPQHTTLHTTLISALSAAVLAVALTACSSPSVPADEATSGADQPSDVPAGTGDFVPDDAWFTAVDDARTSLTDFLGFWEAQDCTMDKVVAGDFNCNIQISGIVQGVNDLNPLLADTVNIAPDSAASIAGLESSAPTAAQAASDTAAYSDAVCDFAPDDACIPLGDAVVASATALSVEIAGWNAP